MDDSNILYYIVIGAIYVISRVLKKRKQNQEPVPTESATTDTVPGTPAKKPSSFEDLFKELTGEDFSDNKSNQNEVVVEEPIQPKIIQTRTNHDTTLAEVIPDKVIERDKPVFERNENFKMKLEDDQTDEDQEVHVLFEDEDSLRKAIILKEVLDRRY